MTTTTEETTVSEPNYLPEILNLLAGGGLKPGTVTVATVAHDGDCSLWSGGTCDCEPEVTITPRTERRDY